MEQYLKSIDDPRIVISDVHAGYFGTRITDNMLVPGKNARLGSIHFKLVREPRKKQLDK